MNMYDKVAATILSAAVGLAFITAGCDKPPPTPVKHEVAHVDPPPALPPPVATNPFEKAAPAPPPPVHEAIQNPHWIQVGGEAKLNDVWSFFTWQDVANHNVCYFYNEFDDKDHHSVIGHGMSCVKE